MNYSKILNQLVKHIEKQNFTGYDPYDLKSISFVKSISKLGNKCFPFEVLREFIFELFYSFPNFFRKLFFVRPQINNKALALIASSYLDFYNLYNDEKYLNLAHKYLKLLKKRAVFDENGIGWGYPFDWVSNELIPKNTPNGIVTTAVGDAFWKYYQINKTPSKINYCKKIATFLSHLKKDKISEEQICFSYTNVYKNHVHNLNLFVAEYLIKIGIELKQNEWIELGNKAVNYTISNQLKDGSFDYNGPPEILKNFVDNYHTGFVLRMLYSIYKLTKREDVFECLNKCYKHYISNFFYDERIPKLLPDRLYRIDIHSCAESINCLSELSDIFPDGLDIAKNVMEWTIENLYDSNGFFYYGIIKSRFTKKPFVSKVDYLRWNQAWMLKAMITYVKSDYNKSGEKR